MLLAGTGNAVAADFSKKTSQTAPPGVVHGGFEAEFGTRMWLGFGDSHYDLFNPSGTVQNSRLTFANLPTASGELFGKLTDNEFFVSGFAGLGSVPGGTLQDEDFAPTTNPYSSTDSTQGGGQLAYATVDLGRYFYDQPGGRIGAFVGYNYIGDQLNSYGCTQTATNPTICVPSVDSSISPIRETDSWNSLRVGINGDAKLDDHWTLSGDAAFLPYVSLSGMDTHWLRIPSSFTGPIPIDGTGWGAQIQAMLDYKVSDRFSLGIGARYWHMQASGNMHFENVLVPGPGSPQPMNRSENLYGLLAEVKASF